MRRLRFGLCSCVWATERPSPPWIFIFHFRFFFVISGRVNRRSWGRDIGESRDRGRGAWTIYSALHEAACCLGTYLLGRETRQIGKCKKKRLFSSSSFVSPLEFAIPKAACVFPFRTSAVTLSSNHQTGRRLPILSVSVSVSVSMLRVVLYYGVGALAPVSLAHQTRK